jgi:FlaA1/EpsC-like NDP-sugar epimerase
MGLSIFKYRTFINMVLPFVDCSYTGDCKTSFQYYFAEKSNVKLSRTIIYGTDANAISVAKALKESPLRFKIVAFIDRNGQNSSKRMLDLPILILKKNFLL